MTEELINDLGQVSTLRVISLTSSMSYKGTKKTLPEIAHELSVDGVVEGGVLREGNQVRVSVQLIDAGTIAPSGLTPMSATLRFSPGRVRWRKPLPTRSAAM